MLEKVKYTILKSTFKLIGNVYNTMIHTLFPNPAFFENDKIALTKQLEADFEQLKEEFLRVHEDRLFPYMVDVFKEANDLNKKKVWKAFFLKSYYHVHEENIESLPVTSRLVQDKNICSAFYSLLEPNSEILPHVGQNKGLIRVFLPLMVPEDEKNCFIVVNKEKRYFKESKCLVFDDYYEHYVKNNTDEPRVVIFIDYVRELPVVFKQINDFALRIVGKSNFMQAMRENLKNYN